MTASYDNPTGQRLPHGAMGIVVGYFLPDDDARMARSSGGQAAEVEGRDSGGFPPPGGTADE